MPDFGQFGEPKLPKVGQTGTPPRDNGVVAAATIEEYLAGFDPVVRERLERVRAAIRSVLPDSAERISYGIPAITIARHDSLYFAGWKHHIGLYPVYPSDDPIEAELAGYRSGKDTLRFLHAQPLPDELIARVARHLVDRAR